MRPSWWLVWLLLLPAPLLAAERLDEVLLDFQQRGYRSPAAAIERLRAVADPPGQGDALERRRRYHGTLADLYVAADRFEEFDREVATLARLVELGCRECRPQLLVVRAGRALRRHNATEAALLLQQLAALPPATDPAVRIAEHYARGIVHEVRGEHQRAIEEAVLTGQLALQAGFPAEQVKALNLLMVANDARNDLERASKIGEEATEMARRLGNRWLEGYVLFNRVSLAARRGDHRKQQALLGEALAAVRGEADLHELEILHLLVLSEFHHSQGRFPEALRIAREALATAQRAGATQLETHALSSIGAAQISLGDRDAGIASLERAAALLETKSAESERQAVLLSLVDALQAAGRKDEALERLREVLALREKLAATERESTAMIAQEQFAVARKDREIERLSIERDKHAAQAAARTWQQRLWAALAVACALAAVLTVQFLQRSRRRNRALEADNATLAEQSHVDPLTGAYNRRYGDLVLRREAEKLPTSAEPGVEPPTLGLMLLDVDHFKHLNDTYGHAVGDQVLIGLVRRLRTLLRQQDAIVRWGGEEFLLLLPGMAQHSLPGLAERVLHAVNSRPFELEGGLSLRISVSVGAMATPSLHDADRPYVVQLVDRALYLAKSEGRNRATCLLLTRGLPADRPDEDLLALERSGDVMLHPVAG